MKLKELLEGKIPDNLKCSVCGGTEKEMEDEDYVGDFLIVRGKYYCPDCEWPTALKSDEKITQITINGSMGRDEPKTFTAKYAREKLGWNIPMGKEEAEEAGKELAKKSKKLPKKKFKL